MSTAAVSTLSIFQELQSFYQNRQADLKQVGNALQSGDLTGAEQAYKALAVLGEGGPFANSEPFSKSSRAQAFDALGEAIQAGDVARAQADFATLTGNHINPAQATPAAVVNLTGTQPSNASDSASSIYQQLQAYRQQRQADLAQLGQALQSGDLTGAQQAFDALTALGQSGPNKNGQLFQRADRTQDFQAIGQALQSSDLAGAQSAFASLAGTFGPQSQQAQSAISAYNGVTEIIINFLGPPTPTIQPTGPPIFQAPPKEPPVSVGPPVGPPVFNPGLVGPPVSIAPPPIEPPVSQPPPISTGSGAEIVINVGGASGNNISGGSTAPELVINLGQGSGSSSASPEEVTINLGSGSAGAQVTIDTTQGTNANSAEQVTINLNQTRNYELILNLFNATALSQAQSSSNALSVSA
jgi:Skp family chaperone for outer membrane proteins